jgi:hypothetical protein
MIKNPKIDGLAETLDQNLADITAKTNQLTKLLRRTEKVFTAVNAQWSELTTKLVSFNKNKYL